MLCLCEVFQFTDTKQQLEDAMEHLNSELSSCRSASRHAMNKLEAVVGDQKKQAKLVAHVTAETTEKLSQIEKWVNTTAPMPPSPEQGRLSSELFCSSYCHLQLYTSV